MSTELLTPPGRIVWGHPMRTQIKKYQQGPQKGQPVIKDGKAIEQWVFGVAYEKNAFNSQMWEVMQREVSTVFPNGVPSRFSWKIKDGDGVDGDGKKYSDREGYAGHVVLTISTEAFMPPVYKNENGRYRQIEPHEIKTGDYVVCKLNLKANAPTDNTLTPSLYINPVGIELIGYGQEIRNSANPDEMFGGRTYQLPAGATNTPQAPQGGAMPPYATAPAPQAAPAQNGYPQPQAAPYAPAAAAPQAPMAVPPYATAPAPQQGGYPPPHNEFVQNAGHQPPQAPPVQQGYPQQSFTAPAPQAAPYAPAAAAPQAPMAAPPYAQGATGYPTKQ